MSAYPPLGRPTSTAHEYLVRELLLAFCEASDRDSELRQDGTVHEKIKVSKVSVDLYSALS